MKDARKAYDTDIFNDIELCNYISAAKKTVLSSFWFLNLEENCIN